MGAHPCWMWVKLVCLSILVCYLLFANQTRFWTSIITLKTMFKCWIACIEYLPLWNTGRPLSEYLFIEVKIWDHNMMSGVDYWPDAQSAGGDTRYEQHSAGSHRPGSVTRTGTAKEGAKDGAKQVCQQLRYSTAAAVEQGECFSSEISKVEAFYLDFTKTLTIKHTFREVNCSIFLQKLLHQFFWLREPGTA